MDRRGLGFAGLVEAAGLGAADAGFADRLAAPPSVGFADIFAGKKVVLFGVPGAFTPTCSNNHLPGYLENLDAIKARGVDTIAVIATNDVHVMGAWARFSGGEGKLLYLADGSGDFARATGLDVDLSQAGMGLRNKRFSLIAEDGVVKAINVESKPGVNESGAAHILGQL